MSQPHRILCIEDDGRLRRLLAEDLTENGYDVAAAGNAATGLLAFFNHAPALVLCDIRMPGKSGFDLFQALRRLDPSLFGAAFIFLTALADRDNELLGRRLGADDYITKPVDYEILHEIIRVRLGGRPPGRRPPDLPPDLAARLSAWFEHVADSAPSGLPDALRGHLAISGFSEQLAPARAVLNDMVDGMALGIIILDGAGKAHYVNESAAACLGGTRQDLVGAQVSPRLTAFARRHLRESNGAPTHLSAERIELDAARDPVTAVARLAPSESGAAPDRVTVLLPMIPAQASACSELLAALFGLTPAERALAAGISEGSALADVATTRGVTLQTVRAQLKSVFGKMGVSRQVDLVRMVLALQLAAGSGPSSCGANRHAG